MMMYPEFVDIRINPETGKVFSFNSGSVAVPDNTKPAITADKAKEV